MKTLRYFQKTTMKSFVFLLFFLPGFILFSQVKKQDSPGGYHGELDFPISWKKYYSYAEWTSIMQEIQKKYPNLSEIESIGKSRMGRDQYLITITNKAMGNHAEKPAMWVDGAVHGNEVNGITCSLYLMWSLLTRYDYDPYVYDLVNTTTFYILPGLNVDANESYVMYPNTANNPRESYRPEDNDGDGLYDEDRTEDVDGDGELSTMYVEDPFGMFKLSPDKRRFVMISDPEEEGLRFRRIGSEGFDNDGDGLINEDDIGGPDLNRNYPYGWNLQAGNPYPMSEPETRNVYEFQIAHDNIYASFHYHNTGRLIMFQAPPETRRNLTSQQREQAQEQIDTRLETMRKTNKYAQLFNRQVSSDYQHDMDVQTKIATSGARILKNYQPVIGGLTGQAHAATYYMLGAYSYLIELWGIPSFDADEDGDGLVSDEEMLKWIDMELTGEGWIDPHKVNHPELGEIWIGGSVKKHMRRTPPSRYIEMEAEKNAKFVMYCASQFPKVEIDKVLIKPKTDELYMIEVWVKNDRVYPTSSDRSVQLEKAVKDKLIIKSSNNISLVELMEDINVFDPLDTGSTYKSIAGTNTEFRLKGNETMKFRGLIKMSGSNGWIEPSVDSKMGGKDSKRINIKVGS
jgi:hypothetical protein